jgi:hypothetical protein
MRSATHLIRAALADQNFNSFTRDTAREVGRFEFYRARLHHLGLPSDWYFGILTDPERDSSRAEAQQRLSEAGELIRNSLAHDLSPLVLLSDDPAVRLSDNLLFKDKKVFFIDRDKLPATSHPAGHIRSAPFLRAIRQKIDQKDLPSLFFEPYKPNQPVDGWQFFGRRKELQLLVNSPQSFIVVGARRIGKTSLLRETKRRLELQGATVHYVSAQELNNAQEVVQAILRTLSFRDAEAAVRRQKAVNETLLQSVLRGLARKRNRVTLIVDELGNVIAKSRQDDWRIMGTFRDFMHTGQLQIIASGYQEFFLKQLESAWGPFVNLAEIVKLRVFTDQEIDEFIVEPLSIWGNVADHDQFRNIIMTQVGRQPLMLQYLGRALFDRIFSRNQLNLETSLLDIIEHHSTKVFENVIDEIFYRVSTITQRFLFLKRCMEAEQANQNVSDAELTDSWVKDTLRAAGYGSTFDGRRMLLESMEMAGLTGAVADNQSRQRILTPIIWRAIKASEPDIPTLVQTFAEEIGEDVRLKITATGVQG